MPLDRIALIGFSGTGKSVVARLLARRLGWSVCDTDQEIVARQGKAVREIFDEFGEPFFREIESVVLAEACRRERVVVSTGGGAPLAAGNRRSLAACFIVGLEAPAETIYKRLSSGNRESLDKRPLLQGEDQLTRIRELKKERASFYSIADLSIDTGGSTPDLTAEQIRQVWLGSSSGLRKDEHRLRRIVEGPDRAISGAGRPGEQ